MWICGINRAIDGKGRKNMKKAIIICFAVVVLLIPALVFASSCDDGTTLVDPTAEDLAQFECIAESIFDVIENAESGVTMSGDPEDPEGGTITFENATYNDVTINGSLHLKISVDYSGPDPVVTFTFSGSLTFTGANACAESFSMDLTLTVDYGASTEEEALSGSGSITVDGTSFAVDEFLADIFEFVMALIPS